MRAVCLVSSRESSVGKPFDEVRRERTGWPLFENTQTFHNDTGKFVIYMTNAMWYDGANWIIANNDNVVIGWTFAVGKIEWKLFGIVSCSLSFRLKAFEAHIFDDGSTKSKPNRKATPRSTALTPLRCDEHNARMFRSKLFRRMVGMDQSHTLTNFNIYEFNESLFDCEKTDKNKYFRGEAANAHK